MTALWLRFLLSAMLLFGSWVIVGGQICDPSAAYFTTPVITSAVHHDFGSPGARVAWNIAIPPECITSVTLRSNGDRLTTFNPPTGSSSSVKRPIEVVASLINTRDVKVTWQWKQSDILTSCYAYTYVIYQPQGGDVSSLWVKKSNATSTDLTGLECDTSYNITVAVIYGHESMESDPVSVHVTPSCGPPGTPNSTLLTPIIGVATVAVLMLVIVVILVLVIRWYKQKKRGISSRVEAELATINAEHEPDCNSSSYADGGEVVENKYYANMKYIEPDVEEFTATNEGGKVEGTTKLVVHAESEWKELQSDPAVESKQVEVDKFGDYVFSFHAQNNAGFTTQFLSLPTGKSGHSVRIAWKVENIQLNRSYNVLPYDDNRVALRPIADHVNPQHDYINASRINGYSRPQKYIATQGPLPTTVTDFWWLVWQEEVTVIVMLTNVVEQGQQKCKQYWPDQGLLEYVGPLRVTLGDQQVFGDYIIRTLQVMHLEKNRCSSREIIQFQFTAWPHYGVPEYTGSILTFLHQVNAQHTYSEGPLLVHCSDGVGRTGALIAIDMALEQGAQEGAVDIPSIVYKIRRQRMKMVWADYQYTFIHDAVLESLICGNTQIQPSDLRNAINTLGQRDKQSGRTGFETQFHVLGQVSPKPTEVIMATALRYPQKNRNSEFLPSDKWRVLLKAEIPDYLNAEIPDYLNAEMPDYLNAEMPDYLNAEIPDYTNAEIPPDYNAEIPDYINASFANGYKQCKGFIIAQAPMKTTCQDFWKMIVERECGLIVMLSELMENGEEICYQYWPGKNETQKYGEFSISILSETVNRDGFVQRLFSITNPESGEVHEVTQLQLSNWTPEGLCTSPKTIMDVTDLLFAVQRRKPVLVHGSDTVSRCGIFCALINVIEHCKTEEIVDVFQAVKALRIQKPGSVLTVEQYRFIFDLVLLFLDSSSIYSVNTST